MSSASSKFTAWVETLPKWHGLLQLSPDRPYMHA